MRTDPAALQMLQALDLLRLPGPGAGLLALRATPAEAKSFAEKALLTLTRHRLSVCGTDQGWEIRLDPECPATTCPDCDTTTQQSTGS